MDLDKANQVRALLDKREQFQNDINELEQFIDRHGATQLVAYFDPYKDRMVHVRFEVSEVLKSLQAKLAAVEAEIAAL